MAYQTLSLTRDQFASFLKDFEQIKQFERLFATTSANVISIDDFVSFDGFIEGSFILVILTFCILPKIKLLNI
jgi:hypothetical protein